MKKFFVSIALILVLASIGYTAQLGIINAQRTQYDSGQVAFYSAATGTTAETTAGYAIFDYPQSSVGCDVMSGASGSTGIATVKFYVNQGTSTTIFDTSTYMTITVVPSLTASVLKTGFVANQPFRTIYATVTTPSKTTVMTVNCSAKR